MIKKVSQQKVKRLLNPYPALYLSGVPMQNAGFKIDDFVDVNYGHEEIHIKKIKKVFTSNKDSV